MSSASVMAICATASAPRNRLPPWSPPILPPALSASTRLTLDAMSAGASPQTKADSSVSPQAPSSQMFEDSILTPPVVELRYRYFDERRSV